MSLTRYLKAATNVFCLLRTHQRGELHESEVSLFDITLLMVKAKNIYQNTNKVHNLENRAQPMNFKNFDPGYKIRNSSTLVIIWMGTSEMSLANHFRAVAVTFCPLEPITTSEHLRGELHKNEIF